MRIIAVAPCLAALTICSASAQQVLQDFNYYQGNLAIRDTSGCIQTAGGDSPQWLCKQFYDIGNSPTSQSNIKSINALEAKVRELTAKNELLEKNLKTLSDAMDVLAARVNKGEAK